MARKITGCIIKNSKGEFLLQKKTFDHWSHGGWCFFGGIVESEDLNSEMQRELKEEIGVELDVEFLFTHKLLFNGEEETMHVFSTVLDDVSEVSLGEGAGFAFFDKSELGKLNIIPDVKEVLEVYFKE